jgi:hypothetical protein
LNPTRLDLFVTGAQSDHSAGELRNFPGGVVDLRYQFALSGDVISELVIAR